MHDSSSTSPSTQLPANVEIEFDMSRSGAGIARDYFKPKLSAALDKAFDHVQASREGRHTYVYMYIRRRNPFWKFYSKSHLGLHSSTPPRH